MTNSQIFKTVEERTEAYLRFCRGQDDCRKCKLHGDDADSGTISCVFKWLDLGFTEEPKPCPFCGGKDIRVFQAEACTKYAACCGCGCRTDIKSSSEKAIAAWNRRMT